MDALHDTTEPLAYLWTKDGESLPLCRETMRDHPLACKEDEDIGKWANRLNAATGLKVTVVAIERYTVG